MNRRKKLPRCIESKVLILYYQGKSIREISETVTYIDSQNKKKNVSIGWVHKIINEVQGNEEKHK